MAVLAIGVVILRCGTARAVYWCTPDGRIVLLTAFRKARRHVGPSACRRPARWAPADRRYVKCPPIGAASGALGVPTLKWSYVLRPGRCGTRARCLPGGVVLRWCA